MELPEKVHFRSGSRDWFGRCGSGEWVGRCGSGDVGQAMWVGRCGSGLGRAMWPGQNLLQVTQTSRNFGVFGEKKQSKH